MIDLKRPNPKPKTDEVLLLFTTPTCASCKMVKTSLKDAGIAHKEIDATKHPGPGGKIRRTASPVAGVTSTAAARRKFAGPKKVLEYIHSHNA